MKDNIDGALKIIEKYYEIANEIIEKYELYNKKYKNYRILKSIDNLNNSNDQIIKSLKKIINEKDIIIRINDLIDIYSGDRKNYKEGVSLTNTLNNDEEKNDIEQPNLEGNLQTENSGKKVIKKKMINIKSKSKNNISTK